jgi:hypothetical protein
MAVADRTAPGTGAATRSKLGNTCPLALEFRWPARSTRLARKSQTPGTRAPTMSASPEPHEQIGEANGQ